jgi:hypothetical protein
MVRASVFATLLAALITFARAESLDPDTALSRLLGGLGGPIDRPFGELYQGFKKYQGGLVTEQYAVPLIIPDGRSLQKNKTDFKDPRLILANPELFIGYAPKAKQLEIISLNSRTGEYDFYIAKNYGKGLTASIVPADRTLCLSCHQHGGPIFSRGPWDESTIVRPFKNGDGKPYEDRPGHVFEGNELYQELAKATGGKSDFDGVVLEDIGVTSPSAFDARVRTAATLLQTRKVCRAICLKTADCTEAMLRLSLKLGTDADRALLDARVASLWPENEFGYPSSVLPNRDPLQDRAHGGTGKSIVITDPAKYRAYLNNEIAPQGKKEFINGDPADPHSIAGEELQAIEYAKKHGFQRSGGLDVTYEESVTSSNFNFASQTNFLGPPEKRGVKLAEYPATSGSDADPTKPRPLVGRIPKTEGAAFLRESAFECLFTERERLVFNKIPVEKIVETVKELNLAKFAADWPKGRNDFFDAMVKGFKARGFEDCCRDLANASQQPITGANKILIEKVTDSSPGAAPPTATETSALFVKYCARCHRGDEIQELPLEKMETLRAKALGKTAIELLSHDRMPPKEAAQPTYEERRRMADFLK